MNCPNPFPLYQFVAAAFGAIGLTLGWLVWGKR